MEDRLPSPDTERLSVLTALVLIAYAFARLVALPTIALNLSLFGLSILLEVNTQLIMITLAAGLAVAGADWTMKSHPRHGSGGPTFEHWIVPGLAALGLGSILTRVPVGLGLGIGLLLAGLVLNAVLAAEFVVNDRDDPRYGPSAIGLRALAYILLVGTLFAERAVGLRAVFAVPLVLLTVTAVTWRLLRLGPQPKPVWPYALVAGGVVSQLEWALHYWPISPVQASLVLSLATYTGESILQALLAQPGKLRARTIETGTVALIALVAIILLA